MALCAFWLEGCESSKPAEPKDQELISIFHAHKLAFEQLQRMSTEDALRGWYLGSSSPSKLDGSHRSQYESLKSQIRPGIQVAVTGPTGIVRVIFASEGSAIGPGWVKGIEYVPSGSVKEGVRLPDLDKAASLPASVYVREIEPRWFVFYQRDE